MPRIRPSEDVEKSGPAQELIEWAVRNGAPDPRIVSIYVRSEAGIAFYEYRRKLMGSLALPLKLKELVRLRAAVNQECGYCTSVRSQEAKDEGVTEALIAEMLDYEYSDCFTEQERTALWYVDLYRKDDRRIDDDAVWDRMRLHFTDPQIIEINLLCQLLTSGFGFVKALQLVSWDEACALNPEIEAVMKRKREREARQSGAGAAVPGAVAAGVKA